MKTILFTLALMAATLTGCSTTKLITDDATREQVSWSAFCAERGYNVDDHTYSATNEYLDTWCGSVQEDQALIKAGCKPY